MPKRQKKNWVGKRSTALRKCVKMPGDGRKTILTDLRIKNFMLKEKKLFLFDIDGTLALGDTLFEGSRDLLDHIASIGGKAYYITNNSLF